MLGFLISLIDLGILTGGNAKRNAEGNYNRKVAKLYNKSYYRDGFNRYRSTETGHIVSVTSEGVRDIKTGILIEDYNEKRRIEKEKYEKKMEVEFEKSLNEYLNHPNVKCKTWANFGDYYYNVKTKEKAIEFPFDKDGRISSALCEPEYKYYIDNRRFYFGINPSDKHYEVLKRNFIENINNEQYINNEYEDYLYYIEHNKKIYNKLQNKDFIEQHNIEITPVSREEFVKKYQSLE